MQVTNATTFRQIHAEFNAGGEFANAPAGKNLRLNTASGLHVHRDDKGSGIHFMKRAEKHEGAVRALKTAINNELGPGAGDTVFKNLGIKGAVSVGDMTAIKGEVDRLATLRPVLPAQGFELAPVRGDPSLVAGSFEHTMGTADVGAFRQKLDHNLNLYDRAAHPLADVTDQFVKDFSRMNIRLVEGRQSVDVPNGAGEGAEARQALADFTGNDATATRALSNFLTQTAFNTMHGELGELMRSADNRTVNVGIASPGADGPKNQTVTASMDGPNHVLIDYKLDTGVSGLAGNGKMLDLSAQGESRLTATMQVRVATADLAAGRLDYQITSPPSFALHAKFDPVRDMM